MAIKLYVGNLGYEVDNHALKELFATHGTVESANVIQDRNAGRSKGFGFVEMSSDQEAQIAINALDGQYSNGRTLKVNLAKPRKNHGGGRGRRDFGSDDFGGDGRGGF